MTQSQRLGTFSIEWKKFRGDNLLCVLSPCTWQSIFRSWNQSQDRKVWDTLAFTTCRLMKSQKDLSSTSPLVVSRLTSYSKRGSHQSCSSCLRLRKLCSQTPDFLLSPNNDADVKSAIALKHSTSAVKLLFRNYFWPGSLDFLVYLPRDVLVKSSSD